jgi:hypothetical protein
MWMPVPVPLFDGDPSYNFCHDIFFIWWVEIEQGSGQNLAEQLNMMQGAHMTVPISGPLHLAKNFRSRFLKYCLGIPIGNGTGQGDLDWMKSVLA